MILASNESSTPSIRSVVNTTMENVMTTQITADALAGVHSQQEAITALSQLLQGATPGSVSLADDATKAIEQFCPALARSIRNAVADWNQGLNSPFLTQLMAASGPSPESRTHHCVGLIF